MNTTFYGRKWELVVECSDGQRFVVSEEGIEKSSLRCTFEINYPGYEGWYFSEFNIWNPTETASLKMIEDGSKVYFSAGYKDGKYGQIFGGSVFQVFQTRENVTDFVLTLVCVDGERLYAGNLSSFQLHKGYTDTTKINAILARSKYPLQKGTVSPNINKGGHFRGTTVCSVPITPLRETLKNSNATLFSNYEVVEMFHWVDKSTDDPILIDPSSGLVGLPQQTEHGVNFRTLLRPDIVLKNPPNWVQLDTHVKQMKGQVGNKNLVPLMDPDGYYQIGGLRHSGDSRGDTWYTDVVGYSMTGKAGLLLTVPSMFPKPTFNRS